MKSSKSKNKQIRQDSKSTAKLSTQSKSTDRSTASSSDKYTAQAIEVLTGLDPVRLRPGMYTDTTRPNHLAQEAIDNSVDEAIAGYANKVEVFLYKDGSLAVIDNGRGMPTDIHPEHGLTGVELILTRLHAGAKFSTKNYKFSGGLHGVGISVVNALSSRLEVAVKKNGQIYHMAFANGDKTSELKVIGKCSPIETGTTVHFWPNSKYFDTGKFSISQLKHVLRAKAVLCPGLTVNFTDEHSGETQQWYYEGGLKDYLLEALGDKTVIPEQPFVGNFSGETETADWAIAWSMEKSDLINESYVNLIPTIQGGTHVNGLRTGLLEAMRDFCELRKLLPRGIKLSSDDI